MRKQPENMIITASAGTGKTYRLAIEYIRLILGYYRREGFKVDSILVLTFTRKATAEIKERIQEHLQLLCSTKAADQKERKSLIQQIRKSEAEAKAANKPEGTDSEFEANEAACLTEEEECELTPEEYGILTSVNLAIMSDRRLLQVMTIDSYINSIFRNIVRPLRSIGEIEIDTLAVEKRMPFLLGKLMRDELRARIDNLLRRKVKRSLDGYTQFFASLIKNRWIYQMIIQSLDKVTLEEHIAEQSSDSQQKIEETWELMSRTLGKILGIVKEVADAKSEPWEKYFNSGTKALFAEFPSDPEHFISEIKDLLQNSFRALEFFKNIRKLDFYNRGKIRSTNEYSGTLNTLVERLRTELSGYLYYRYLLAEQHEILRIWATILGEYDKLIYRYKNMTYDDISWFTLQTLFGGDSPAFRMKYANEANEFYQFLTHRSRFILIDEFQDTSLMQFQILKPIIEEVCAGEGTKDFGGLIVVGDEKQSIFGWRGGERDLLIKLGSLVPSIQRFRKANLDTSYRTSPTLMKLINSIFMDEALHTYLGEDMKWEYQEVSSARKKIDRHSHISFHLKQYKQGSDRPNLDDVRKQWIEKYRIKEEVEQGKSIAILCRTNNELMQMQDILDELKIASVYQPNAELPDHPLVQPLISFMKWIAYGDWTDWLTWLRSDYIRIKPKLLKDAIDQIHLSRKANTSADFSHFDPHLQELYIQRPETESSPHSICQDLVIKYLDPSQLGDRDQLNLDAFLDLAKAFELDSSTTDTSIPSFLQYLEDLREQDRLKQISIEGKGGVELLSIHKSKGLQFDRVFVYHNLSGGGGGQDESLDWYPSFLENDVTKLNKEKYALSFNYGKVLEFSHLRDLYESNRKNEYLEEMNTLYVALTRAKTALHVLFVYRSKEEWVDYFAAKTADRSINQLPFYICDAGLRWVAEHGENSEVIGSLMPEDEEEEAAPEEETQDQTHAEKLQADTLFNADNLAQALDFASYELEMDKESDDISPKIAKETYLYKRARLLGEMRHYYLSHLIYNTQSEQEIALKRTMNIYASLLSRDLITSEIEQLKAKLTQYEWLFDRRWDKVFNELELVIKDRQLRLDRLMIDTKQKQVLIVDYKSGDEPDSTQLDSYQQALQQLPIISSGAYEIKTEYLSLK